MRDFAPLGSSLTQSRASASASSPRRCERNCATELNIPCSAMLSEWLVSIRVTGSHERSLRCMSDSKSRQLTFSQSYRSSTPTVPFHGSSHSAMNDSNSGSSYPSGCSMPLMASRAASSLRQAIWPAAITILASSSSPPCWASTLRAVSIASGHRPRNPHSSIRARLFSSRTIDWSPSIFSSLNWRSAATLSLYAALEMCRRIQSPPPDMISPSRRSSGERSKRSWRNFPKRERLINQVSMNTA